MAADDEDETLTKDALFTEAVQAYVDFYTTDTAGSGRQPDRALSRIKPGREATVVLMDPKGVPIGTVTWSGDGKPAFEPPTKITVVDFHTLRPTKD